MRVFTRETSNCVIWKGYQGGIAVKCARVGNKILSFIAMVLVLIMLLYGGYSLWNTIMIYRGAFSSNDLLKYQPTGDGPNSITLGELMKLNKDVVGWITIFDTHISYPVVQGKDNQEYLNKDVFGKFFLFRFYLFRLSKCL